MNEKKFVKFLEEHGYEFCDAQSQEITYSPEAVIQQYLDENRAYASLIAVVARNMDKLSYVSKENFSISEEIVKDIIKEIDEHPRKYEQVFKNFEALI